MYAWLFLLLVGVYLYISVCCLGPKPFNSFPVEKYHLSNPTLVTPNTHLPLLLTSIMKLTIVINKLHDVDLAAAYIAINLSDDECIGTTTMASKDDANEIVWNQSFEADLAALWEANQAVGKRNSTTVTLNLYDDAQQAVASKQFELQPILNGGILTGYQAFTGGDGGISCEISATKTEQQSQTQPGMSNMPSQAEAMMAGVNGLLNPNKINTSSTPGKESTNATRIKKFKTMSKVLDKFKDCFECFGIECNCCGIEAEALEAGEEAELVA